MLTLEDWHQMKAMETGELQQGYAADQEDDFGEDSLADSPDEEHPEVPDEVPDELPGEHLQ